MSESMTIIKDTTANPAPLGLLGFGMTTILLNLHNADLFPLNAMILSMGFFYGGIAQIIAGLMEWKKGNTFGTTAFTSYGLFWLSLIGLLVFPQLGIAQSTSSYAMGWYLLVWGVLTAFLFVGTLRLNHALQFVFLSLTLLFFLLAIGDFTGSELITRTAGYEGILCGVSACYVAIAQILNEVYGKTLLPLWPVEKK